MLTLFDAGTSSLESKVFRLDSQVTVMAVGMADGDYITFEVVKVKAAARQQVCGCYITPMMQSAIEGTETLQCAGCFPSPVTLTADDPILILDSPQNSLLRAIYNGTGLDDGTASVWVESTNVPNVTDAMRGCLVNCDTTGDGNGNSLHGVPVVTVAPASAPEGRVFCWNVSLDSPVIGSPVYLTGRLTGSEESQNTYPFPTAVIYEGQSFCQLCVQTVDNGSTNDTQLYLQLQPNARLAGVPDPVMATVTGTHASSRSTHTVASVVPNEASINEGDQACWEVTLDSAVAGTDLTVNFTLSGSEQTAHGYTLLPAIIPVGASSATVCVPTMDDEDPTNTSLCLKVKTSSRITAVPAPSCISVVGSAPVSSTHTVVSVVPVATPITEGATAQWVVTLDSPVSGAGLLVGFVLSGAEQSVQHYTAPSYTFPIGATTGTVSVVTTDDTTPENALNLCLKAKLSSRVTAVPAASCISVGDNDTPSGGDSIHTIASVTVSPSSATEGATYCWTVTLDAPVSGTDLTVYGNLTGSEQDVHLYPGPSGVIAVGQDHVDLCVTTIDDSIGEAPTSLCLDVVLGPRITAAPAAVCATVNADAVIFDPPGKLAVVDRCCALTGLQPVGATLFYKLSFHPDGSLLQSSSCESYPNATWVTGTFDPSDYEVNAPYANTTGNGGLDVWVNLGSAVDFIYTVSKGSNNCNSQMGKWLNDHHIQMFVSIRKVGSHAIVTYNSSLAHIDLNFCTPCR